MQREIKKGGKRKRDRERERERVLCTQPTNEAETNRERGEEK